MRIVITGGCGFLGRRVAMRLLDRGTARGPVEELVLFDNAPPALPLPEDRRLPLVTGDIADRETVARLIAPQGNTAGTDAVFHLAAIVSGQAEADTDLGYRVNLDGTRAVLDACRALGPRDNGLPRLIFASSLAVYGGALPPEVGEDDRADAAKLLRRAEGDRRIAGQRLQPQGLYRRHGAAPADRRRAAGSAEPRRLDLRLVDHPRAADRARGGLSGVARHGHGAGVAAPHRRRPRACARPACRRARREPVVAIAGVFGLGRRDGRGAAPRRRRGGLPAHPVAARPANPGDHFELAASAARAARRGARIRPRQRHRRGHRGLYRGRSARCSAGWPDSRKGARHAPHSRSSLPVAFPARGGRLAAMPKRGRSSSSCLPRKAVRRARRPTRCCASWPAGPT